MWFLRHVRIFKGQSKEFEYPSKEQNYYTDDSKTILKALLGSVEEDEDDEAVAVEETVQVQENVDGKEAIETEEIVEVEKTAVVERSVEDEVDIVSN